MDAPLLIQKRGRILGLLTKAAFFIENVHDELLTEEIEARLLKVESWWESFYNIEDQLLLLPQQTSKSDEFEEKFFKTTRAMIREIQRRNPAELNMPTDDLNAIVGNMYYQQRAFVESFNQIINQNNDVKRPTKNIPPFNGKYAQWPSFNDLFEVKPHFILQDPVEHPAYTKETNNNVTSICATRIEDSQPDSCTSILFTTKNPSHDSNQSILPTVIIRTNESKGKIYHIRALMDSGSESTFITEHLTKTLELKRKHACVAVNGLSSIAAGQTRGMTNLKLSSIFDCSKFVFVDALILNKLTTSLPSQSIILDEHLPSKLSEYCLADLAFNETKSIEMLLGIDVFYETVKEGRITIQHNLHLIDSLFGWIITGFSDDSIKSVTVCYTIQKGPDEPYLSGEDAFTFIVPEISSSKFTKQSLLSECSKLFNPLGWIALITINFKNLLQSFRLTKIEWDDPLPEGVNWTWCSIRNELSSLAAVRIPRHLLTQPPTNIIQYHGFCDASKRAYPAVVYVRATNTDRECFASKTKIAPLKQLFVPRSELRGAVLLTKLFHKISDIFQVPRGSLYAGTDSSSILLWLSNVARKWNCFVANRTSCNIEKLPNNYWNHVPSSFNPADCTSGGILPSEFLKHTSSSFIMYEQLIKGEQILNIQYSTKHPAVSSKSHQLPEKIVSNLHHKQSHPNHSTLFFTTQIYAS